jgi:cytochrome c
MKTAMLIGAALAATLQPAIAADAAAGQVLFAQKCAPCHSIGSDDGSQVGPRLDGVVGRRAGSAGSFLHYSLPMGVFSWSGGTWTPAPLAAYLKKPGAFLPGTNMTFYGVASPAQRQDIIAYLASFPAE